MEIDPKSASPKEMYFRMISCIVPRPIAWVSSVSDAGVSNLAPFSFFTGVSSSPPTVVFCVASKRDGELKDTAANILATGEFVVNVVNVSQVHEMVQTSAAYEPDVDEFAAAGLIPVASTRVRPSRVSQAPVSMECRLHEVVEIKDDDDRVTTRMIIGRIVYMHIDDDVLDDEGRVDPTRLMPVARLGGRSYTPLGEPFDIPHPRL